VNPAVSYATEPGDYHLTAGSAARGIGSHTYAPATDKDGVTRGSPPDDGAYQYAGG